MMLALTKPKFFIPIHGEYKHMKKHEGLAIKMGIPEKNIFLLNIGQVVETDSVEMKVVGQVPAGKVLVDVSEWEMSARSYCVTESICPRMVLL